MSVETIDLLQFDKEIIDKIKMPMVEVFQTVEGEGTRAGYPTTFVRVYNCNLRCTWCDTTYSYAPSKPEYYATIEEIVSKVEALGHHHICLTGGEPLMHKEKSLYLVFALSQISCVKDLHIETNGAIPLDPFVKLREKDTNVNSKVRFIMDYKLPKSGEMDKMVHSNFALLDDRDEIKFVIGDKEDFDVAVEVKKKWHQKGIVLFSPVWDTMHPAKLVELILSNHLDDVKLSLQIHKVIWHPSKRGV